MANLRIDTLTRSRTEAHRISLLRSKGHFERPVFPVPVAIANASIGPVLDSLEATIPQFDCSLGTGLRDAGFTLANEYFTSPDAEVLYAIVRMACPRTVVEVGCGFSTMVFAQAIADGALNTCFISVDPEPRTAVNSLGHSVLRMPVQDTDDQLWDQLDAGDILFIDSSHTMSIGSDVVFLFSSVVPRLRPGVLLHVHDIFLPYDYPERWMADERRMWNEQYLVQAMLTYGDMFEVVWPAHYLQRTRREFSQYFCDRKLQVASSLWLRKIR